MKGHCRLAKRRHSPRRPASSRCRMDFHLGTGISPLEMAPTTATEPGHLEPAPKKGSPMQIITLTDDDIFIHGATQAHLLQHPQVQISAANSVFMPTSQMVLLRDHQCRDLGVYHMERSIRYEERALSDLADLNQWERAEQLRIPTAQVVSAYVPPGGRWCVRGRPGRRGQLRPRR